jgi:putative MFS transporter
MMCFIWLGASFGVGMFFSFLPTFLRTSSEYVKLSVDETYRNYFIVHACGVPGTLLASFSVDRFGRKGIMAIATAGTAGALFLFTTFKTPSGQLTSSIVAQFLGNIMWGVLYSYTAEVFPTSVRTLGFGLASSVGRVGSAIAPIATGLLLAGHGSTTPLYISSCVLAFTALLMIGLPLETRHTIVN